MKALLIILFIFTTPFLPQAQETDGTAGQLQLGGHYLFDITEKWDTIGITGGWSVGNGIDEPYSEYQYFGVLDFNNHPLDMMKSKLTVYGDTINMGEITLKLPLYGSDFEVISETLTINEVVSNTPDIRLFPNPTSTYATIKTNSIIDKIDVYTLTGKLVYRDKVGYPDIILDVTNFSSGTYLVNVWIGNYMKVKKFVVR